MICAMYETRCSYLTTVDINVWTVWYSCFTTQRCLHFCREWLTINTCTKLQLLLGEGSSAFLEGKFEPFSRYLAMGDTWRSASPSSCSPTRLPLLCLLCAKGGLGRAQAVPHGRVFFFRISSQARHTCFFTVPCGIITDNYLFGPCDPQLYLV